MKVIKEFIRKINIQITIQLLIVILLISINVIYTNYRVSSSHKQYVTVATNAISKRFLASVIRANLPDNTYKNLLKTFDKTLTKTINNVSNKNGFIILKQNTVLTSLPDITVEVEGLVWKDMELDKLLLNNNEK